MTPGGPAQDGASRLRSSYVLRLIANGWAATVSCMRDLFAPFDVTVVEADPGNVPHIEAERAHQT